MNETLESYLTLPEQDGRNVFEAAGRLDTLPSHVDSVLWGLVVSTGFGAKVSHG